MRTTSVEGVGTGVDDLVIVGLDIAFSDEVTHTLFSGWEDTCFLSSIKLAGRIYPGRNYDYADESKRDAGYKNEPVKYRM